MAKKKRKRSNNVSSRKRNENVRKAPKNPTGRYKLLTVCVFLGLAIYLVGHLVAFAFKPSTSVETVNYGTIDSPKSFSGIVIRDEYVETATMDGEPAYLYAENERVPKGAAICTIKDTGMTNSIEGEIKKIDENILDIQKARTDISSFSEDIAHIENTITDYVDNTAYKFVNNSVSDVYALKTNILNQMKQRNNIWISENTKSTNELTVQRSQYEKQLSGASAVYYAKESGILSLEVDNLESVITPDVRADISKEQINMKVQPQYISKSLALTKDNPVFKIVTSNVWYVAAYAPNSEILDIDVGDRITISTVLNDSEIRASMIVEQMTHGDEETYLVLKSDKNMIDFLQVREMEFKIVRDSYSGLKIPNEAIFEKAFLKVPDECIIDNLDSKQVIVSGSNGDTAVPVKVLNSKDGYSYIPQDFSTIKLGDTIYKGLGDGAQKFVINDVESYKCVYIANSSIAQYVIVDVCGSNSEYSIVRADNPYGLKVYDKIVSDAKSIEESESVN